MKKLTKAKAVLCLIAAIVGAAFLADPVPAYGQAKDKVQSKLAKVDSAQAQRIDLRPRMKQMKWKEGSNLVYSGSGVKLMAQVKGSQVARWTATDDNGRPLRTQVMQQAQTVTCTVCVDVQTGGGGHVKTCFEVDCSKLPPPTTKSQS